MPKAAAGKAKGAGRGKRAAAAVQDDDSPKKRDVQEEAEPTAAPKRRGKRKASSIEGTRSAASISPAPSPSPAHGLSRAEPARFGSALCAATIASVPRIQAVEAPDLGRSQQGEQIVARSAGESPPGVVAKPTEPRPGGLLAAMAIRGTFPVGGLKALASKFLPGTPRVESPAPAGRGFFFKDTPTSERGSASSASGSTAPATPPRPPPLLAKAEDQRVGSAYDQALAVASPLRAGREGSRSSDKSMRQRSSNKDSGSSCVQPVLACGRAAGVQASVQVVDLLDDDDVPAAPSARTASPVAVAAPSQPKAKATAASTQAKANFEAATAPVHASKKLAQAVAAAAAVSAVPGQKVTAKAKSKASAKATPAPPPPAGRPSLIARATSAIRSTLSRQPRITDQSKKPPVPSFSEAPRLSEQLEPWQILRQKPLAPPAPADNYELSDKGEDSDVEEPDRSRKHIPAWSLNYLQMIATQQDVDPDTIFGSRVPHCNLEDIFREELYRRANTERPKRKRGSSGRWEHDKLSSDEVRVYKQKMGHTRRWLSKEK